MPIFRNIFATLKRDASEEYKPIMEKTSFQNLSKFRIEWGIALVMVLTLILVVVTGTVAYQRFTAVVKRLNAENPIDKQQLLAEVLYNELTDADNHVKSFTLTKDTVYLDLFMTNVSEIDRKIEELKRIDSAQGGVEIRMDRLEYLIEQKLGVLQEVLILQDAFRVQEALTRVDDEVTKLGERPKADKSKHLMKRLLTRPKVRKQAAVAEVKSKINMIKSDEQRLEDTRKDLELEYFTEDKKITTKIRSILDVIQVTSVQVSERKAAAAAVEVKSTNQQIAMFCILAGVLILVMAYIITTYILNNSKYRQALRLAKQEAEELAQTKSRFLANMSHEIRTPLNAIVGFADQLEETSMNEEQASDLDMIRRSADHLLYIINDILDLTKLQAKKLSLEKVVFKPQEVIEEVVQLGSAMAKEKGIRLHYDWNSRIPEGLIGDPYRLRQIILNLMNNSIKFTAKGEVKISCNVQELISDQLTFLVEVKDTGIGMSADQVQKVFKEFEQAELSTTREYGGSGLGLSIVKMLVELHDGQVSLQSAPNEGTIVRLELPYQIGQLKTKKTNRTDGEYKVLDGKRVLVVDDEPFNRKLLERLLTKYKSEVMEVENGQKALEVLEDNSFDVILMDMRMPVMNGMEATKAIRELNDESRRHLPIIALTAAATSEEKNEIKNLNINGFLSKPFKEKDLLKILTNVWTDPANKSSPSVDEKIEKELGGKQNLNFDYLRSSFPDDDGFYREMLDLFVKGVEDGCQGFDDLIPQNDQLQMAEIAHKMSTPCKHMGADGLYVLLKDVEAKGRKGSLEKEWESTLKQIKKLSEQAIEEVNREVDRLSNLPKVE